MIGIRGRPRGAGDSMDSTKVWRVRARWLFLVIVLAGGVMLASGPALAQGGGTPADSDPGPSGAGSADEDSLPGVDATSGEDRPWSKGVPLERRQAARAIFLEGNELIKDTLFAKAADRYREAIATWDHPAFHYNLAIAQINLDQPIEAYESLQRAMRHGTAPLGASRHEQTLNYLKLLESQLARIEVVCNDAGAEVSLDGKPLFVGPGRHQGLVRPGAHQLVASKPGYLIWSEPVVVSSGERMSIEVTLVTLDQVSESSRRWATWKPWAVVGGGAVVALAGGVVHRRAAVSFGEYDDEFLQLGCVVEPDPDEPGCTEADVPAHMQDKLRQATWEQRIAVASYTVGGAALATGLVLVYLNRPRLTQKAEQAEKNRPANISFSPVVTPRSMGLSATLRF
jgi:hypothetical protein